MFRKLSLDQDLGWSDYRPGAMRRLGWKRTHMQYTCVDETSITLPCQMDQKDPQNAIHYIPNHKLSVFASCMELDRDMQNVILTLQTTRTLTLPHTVKRLGKDSLAHVRILEAVRLNEGLEYIGPRPFSSHIRQLTFPASLKDVDQHALDGCKALKTVYVADGCEVNVKLCANVPVAVRPFKLASAAGQSVWGLRMLKEVVIPDGTQQIRNYWFTGSCVQCVKIPASVESIGREAFCECRGLRSVKFAENALTKYIGPRAFEKTAIRTFNSPEALCEIEELAFYDCKNLKAVRLGENVQNLGKMCFLNTRVQDLRLSNNINVPLEELGLQLAQDAVCVIPDRMPYVGSSQISQDAEYVVVPGSVQVLGASAFADHQQLKQVLFLENSRLCSIESCCFQCSTLTSIQTPPGLQRIGAGAFMNCENLQSVELNEGLEELGELVFARSTVQSIRFPSTLSRFSNAFYDCTTIRQVFLPIGWMDVCWDESRRRYAGTLTVSANVQSIQYHPSYALFDIERIVFEDGSQLNEIGDYAFKDTQIESFVAPPSLRKIGLMAFKNCARLKDVRLNLETTELDRFCFWGTQVTELQNAPNAFIDSTEIGLYGLTVRELVLPEGLEVVGDRWFAESNIESLVLSKSVHTLGAAAFQNCNRLLRVYFPEDSALKTIKGQCFQGSGIQELQTPQSLRNISKEAFSQCAALTSVQLNDGLMTLGSNVFADSGVRDISFPSTVKNLPSRTFYNCNELSQVYLAEGLTEVCERCFQNSGLREINIPTSVQEIKAEAFHNCARLQKAQFVDIGQIMQIDRTAFSLTNLKVTFPKNTKIVDAEREAQLLLGAFGL